MRVRKADAADRRGREAVPADYASLRRTAGERLCLFGKSILYGAGAGWLFYDSLLGGIVLIPCFLAAGLLAGERMARQKRWQLNLEFRDGLEALSAALAAGYSAENAFGEALSDLKQLYPEDSLIVREFRHIHLGMKSGNTVQDMLSDLAERSGVEDIVSFAAVFAAAKLYGGDMIRVLRRSIDKIGQKIETKREIRILLEGRRYETMILKGMPCGSILYLRVFSDGFLSPLYHSVSGAAVMSVLLLLYCGFAYLADRLTEIEI